MLEVGALQQKILRWQNSTVMAQNLQFTDFQLRLYQNRLGGCPQIWYLLLAHILQMKDQLLIC